MPDALKSKPAKKASRSARQADMKPKRKPVRRKMADGARPVGKSALIPLLDEMPCLAVILRPNQTVLHFNRFAQSVTGHSASEVVGKNYLQVFIPDPERRKSARRELRSLFANGPAHLPSAGFELPMWDKEGQPRWVLWHGYVLPQFNGGVAALAIGCDITERKRVEQELLQRELSLRAVLETAASMTVILRKDHTLAYCSPHAEKITGYTAQEVLGKDYLQVFIREEALRGILAKHFQEVFAGVQPRGYENPIWCKDGSQRWFAWNAQILADYQGEAGILGFGVDITERKQTDEALRSSEARSRALLEAIPDWMFRFRPDGTFVDFHAHDPGNLLMPPEAIVGTNMFQSPMPKPVVEQILAAARQALQTGQLQSVEYTLPLPSEVRHYEARIVPSERDELVAIVRDITRRKKLNNALRRMSKVFMDAADPIVIVDLEGHITDLNEAAVQAYGWSPEELLGRLLTTLLPPERHPYSGERLARCRREGTYRNVEGVRWNKEGERLPVLMTYSLLTDEAGNPVGIATIAKDISELKGIQQQLQQLTARLISSQEEASRRIAPELHDAFSQRLAMLGLEVSALELQLASSPDQAVERLRWMAEEIGSLAKDVHQLSRRLHPSILHDLGLSAALRAECDSFSRQQGIPVRFSKQEVPETLPEDVALCLYRVTQECFQNVSKHAAAQQVQVSLAGTEGGILLRIEDFGQGFDPAEIKGKGGLGLVSMQERVRLVDGSFAVKSEPGKGTQVEVRIPFRQT